MLGGSEYGKTLTEKCAQQFLPLVPVRAPGDIKNHILRSSGEHQFLTDRVTPGLDKQAIGLDTVLLYGHCYRPRTPEIVAVRFVSRLDRVRASADYPGGNQSCGTASQRCASEVRGAVSE